MFHASNHRASAGNGCNARTARPIVPACSAHRRLRLAGLIAALSLGVAACASAPRATMPPVPDRTAPVPAATSALPARVVPGDRWRDSPALGVAADASRRNIPPGGTLAFRDLTIDVLATRPAAGSAAQPSSVVDLRLTRGRTNERRTVTAGTAFEWNGYRVAVVAIPAPGELGAGFVALEVATLASLPPHVARATAAGGADMRLRVPHRITRVTLHHTGSAAPLRRDQDPVQLLRALQSWGARDRNWWDVPYHYLIDLDGNVYEGRDWRFMGETNTAYDPGGHFLISVIGNYELQQPTPAQLEAIADMMAWAIRNFDVPLDRIGGHYEFAGTVCPGRHLRGYLGDGTFRRMVEQRLRAAR